MKKAIIYAFLAVGMMVNAQIRFADKEYTTFNVLVDPSASIKEGSLNAVIELEHNSYWKYVKVNIQILPGLQGGYADITGGFGVNLTSGNFNRVRYYSGGRLGYIKRGFSEGKSYTYPLAGFEGGIDFKLTEGLYLGVRGTGDYRTDFKYSGADPLVRYSGFVKLGIKL